MANGTVNASNLNKDLTVRIYDQFYNYDVNVPAAEYDIVYSYFASVMPSKQAAGNFTVSIFQVADSTKISPLVLLDEFKGINNVDLSVSLAYYLNQIRSRATLLGVGVAVVPNYYAVRTVMQ